ncbi:MAG: DUF423 domain-containing protein [Flavobacteriaceae bacterium]|jgi:uncharacterized membrane protein YgdD (TMEM256/DUF423 family)
MLVLLTQFFGALLGMLAVIFGAFGAHALKKKASAAQLASFETGVKYQIYHALVLLVLGYNFSYNNPLEDYIVGCFLLGTFLFSFSIYGLVLAGIAGKKARFLGPITPLGGLLLTIGWALLAYTYIEEII